MFFFFIHVLVRNAGRTLDVSAGIYWETMQINPKHNPNSWYTEIESGIGKQVYQRVGKKQGELNQKPTTQAYTKCLANEVRSQKLFTTERWNCDNLNKVRE